MNLSNINVLFVCSRNQWRSPTAEAVWRKFEGLSVRSAGTSPQAKRTVTANDIQWADVIFCMEDKHQQRLNATFKQWVRPKQIEVLDLPDEYQYMDPDLVECLRDKAEAFLEELKF